MNKKRIQWALQVGTMALVSGVALAGTPQMKALKSLEALDSAANLLLTVADSDRPGACGITPSEAKKLLMAIHPMIDEKRSALVSTLSAQPAGQSIANPQWERTCAKKCHCGLYASILEGVPEGVEDQKLLPADRAALDRLNAKAKETSSKQLRSCAKASSWFCKSGLLKKLRLEAKDYPDSPASK